MSFRGVTKLKVSCYRSINDAIAIEIPKDKPLVLFGENNAGKSNIIRALDLILGESWPGSHQPEDHEFWNRVPGEKKIQIGVKLEGVAGWNGRPVSSLVWECGDPSTEPNFTCHYKDGGDSRVNNDIRHQCTVVVIGADRRLSYQLSYASKWTLLSKLMKGFHRTLVGDQEREDRLRAEFEDIKEIFDEVDEFANFQAGLAEHFDEMLAGMSYQLGIDFSAYDPSNYFHSLRVFPTQGDETRTFEELGTGQEQVLAFAFAHAYAKAFYGGLVLVVEEPEAHLHPLAQRWLARKIREMTQDGLQVVMTTHSPSFVDIMDMEGLCLVRKADGSTTVNQILPTEFTEYCLQHGSDPQRTTTETILPFYRASSTLKIMEGMFAKRIILVEGQTEHLALPVYLSELGLDADAEGVAVLPVMGKGNLAKWWRFFSAYGIPVYVIFDNDPGDDANESRRRDLLSTLQVPDEELNQYIGTDEWLVRDRFSVFGEDFEGTLKRYFASYEEFEEAATEELGSSKPLVARRVAERLERDEPDAGWERLEALVESILRLGAGD